MPTASIKMQKSTFLHFRVPADSNFVPLDKQKDPFDQARLLIWHNKASIVFPATHFAVDRVYIRPHQGNRAYYR